MKFNQRNIFISLIITIIVSISLLFFINGIIWVYSFFILITMLISIYWYFIYISIDFTISKNKLNIPNILKNYISLSLILFFTSFFILGIEAGVRYEKDYWFVILWNFLKNYIVVMSILNVISFTVICIYFDKIKKKYNKYLLSGKKIIKHLKYICTILIIFCLIFKTLLFFPIIIHPFMETKANSNQDDLNVLVNDLTRGFKSDENITKALLSWFESDRGNIYNTWASPYLKSIFSKNIYLSFALGNPYFIILCVRNDGDENPKWILTGRCGNCGEHSLLFTEMAISANISVREIHVNGIDHRWNEALINNKWIISDPTWVNFDDYENGYNVDWFDYENSQGEFVYVYASYPYQNKQNEDVTKNYTELAIVNISVVDINNNPISNISIKVNAYYDGEEIDTGLSFITNNNGYYQLIIGGGTIKFECSDKDKNIQNNSKYEVYENQYNEIVLSVN